MSGARPDTWMPLYCGDYLRDTMHLRAEGHGAYLLLIMAYWTSGQPLPDDDDSLSCIARLDEKAWKRLRPTLARFFKVSDGLWRHGRIDEELDKAKRNMAARQEAGKRGGKAKANGKQNPSNATNPLLANGKQNPTPSPSPSPIEDSEPNGSDAVAVVVTPPDLRKSIFDDGLPWLVSAAGKPEPALRSMLGKWCRDYGDEGVLTTIRACMRSPPVDPVAWIERSLKGHSNGKRPNEPVSFTETVARLAAEKAQSHHS